MNLYFPVYKRIEKEVIDITDKIFFNDSQLNVFSLSMGDIIIRCAVEIEAIAKELYLMHGGNPHPLDKDGKDRDIYFDTDCIALMVENWDIDKKKIQIVNPNMYFSQDASVITPLHKANKRGTSGSKWKQAYQNIKHNRSKSIHMASVENMLNAVGALYILNLYYANECFWCGTPIQGRREFNSESQLFQPLIANATMIHMSADMGTDSVDEIKKPSLEEAVYVRRITEETFKDIQKAHCEIELEFLRKASLTDGFKQYVITHQGENYNYSDALAASGVDYTQVILSYYQRHGVLSKMNNQELILNKNEELYPSLTYEEYLNSPEGISKAKEFGIKVE